MRFLAGGRLLTVLLIKKDKLSKDVFKRKIGCEVLSRRRVNVAIR